MRWFSKILAVCTLLLMSAPLYSEVFFLKNGEVIIGNLSSAGAGTVTIVVSGQEKTFAAHKIIRTETSLSAIAEIPLHIYLKDGTVIRGKIVDYEEDIGVFIDITFGNLVLPHSVVDTIREPLQTARFAGKPNQLGLHGFVDWPLSPDFDLGWGLGLVTDFKLPLLRGLYWGAGMKWIKLSYSQDTEAQFSTLSLGLHTTLKYLDLGEALAPLSFLQPYVQVGAEAVLVQLDDSRPEAPVSQRGLLTAGFSGELGLEWNLIQDVSVRTFGGLNAILQSDGLYTSVTGGLAVLYNF